MGNINDIAEVAEGVAVVNHAQLVGAYDGTIHNPIYNWSKFFEGHTIQTAMKGISQMQHFRFSADHPGVVFVKNANDQCCNGFRKKSPNYQDPVMIMTKFNVELFTSVIMTNMYLKIN